ncbi:hypothetical protein NA619_06655 [Pseudomonas stutzeri]|nr:hypothetical protein [Stutzerimonas stutzeri]MCQ4257682.1 hypothetical protein [Stutzerimonas stutzeri]
MKIRYASANEQKIRNAEEFWQSGIEIIKFPVRIVETQIEDLNQLVSDTLFAAFQTDWQTGLRRSLLPYISLNESPGGLTQTFCGNLHAVRFSDLIGSLDDTSAVSRTLIGYCDGRKRHFFIGEVTGRNCLHASRQRRLRVGRGVHSRRLPLHLCRVVIANAGDPVRREMEFGRSSSCIVISMTMSHRAG